MNISLQALAPSTIPCASAGENVAVTDVRFLGLLTAGEQSGLPFKYVAPEGADDAGATYEGLNVESDSTAVHLPDIGFESAGAGRAGEDSGVGARHPTLSAAPESGMSTAHRTVPASIQADVGDAPGENVPSADRGGGGNRIQVLMEATDALVRDGALANELVTSGDSGQGRWSRAMQALAAQPLREPVGVIKASVEQVVQAGKPQELYPWSSTTMGKLSYLATPGLGGDGQPQAMPTHAHQPARHHGVSDVPRVRSMATVSVPDSRLGIAPGAVSSADKPQDAPEATLAAVGAIHLRDHLESLLKRRVSVRVAEGSLDIVIRDFRATEKQRVALLNSVVSFLGSEHHVSRVTINGLDCSHLIDWRRVPASGARHAG